MSIVGQVRNFIRVLFRGPPRPLPKADSSLAKTAQDLKVVNMSVEDDRLANRARNQAYTDSLE